MRLTSYSDYAFRTLVYLGGRPDQTVGVSTIAEAFGISTNHLAKVALELTRAGFLESRRGPAGGIRLARIPAAICLGDVLRATEPDFQLVECFTPETNRCVLTGACALQDILGTAMAAFIAVLDGHTLADLLRSRKMRERLLSL